MMRQIRLHFLYFWLAMSAVHSGAVSAEPIPEYDIKAAFLYNFTQFTEWPAASEKAVRLCIFGSNPFGSKLEDLVQKTTNNRKLSVQHLGNLNNIDNCQVLFISELERTSPQELLAATGKSPILTISDDKSLFESGMMVGLFVDRNRIVFDINYTSIRNANLSMSSKVLNLARKVNY
jgi:hypothetical protein